MLETLKRENMSTDTEPVRGPITKDWVWGALFPRMIKRDNWLKKYIDLKIGLI